MLKGAMKKRGGDRFVALNRDKVPQQKFFLYDSDILEKESPTQDTAETKPTEGTLSTSYKESGPEDGGRTDEDDKIGAGEPSMNPEMETSTSQPLPTNPHTIPSAYENDVIVKSSLREMLLFLIFLILACIIAFGMISTDMYYFTSIVHNLVFETKFQGTQTLLKSRTIEHFWQFAETVLVDVFHNQYINTYLDPVAWGGPDDVRKLLYENRLLGVPRLRQLRVRDDTCLIHADVQKLFRTCYGYYNSGNEDRAPYGGKTLLSLTRTAWVYTSAKTLNNGYYMGLISYYGGGGFYLDLSEDQNITVDMIKELKENFWVTQGTRAIFIDFTVYNANVNLFLVCKIVLEFPPLGGMIPTADFHTLKLLRYVTAWDFFVLGCEFIFIVFIIYYTIREIQTVKNQKSRYFCQFWNYINLIILLLAHCVIFLGIARYIYMHYEVSALAQRTNTHAGFSSACILQVVFNYFVAVLIFLCWVKLFKYLSFSRTMNQLNLTLSRCGRDIFGFSFMFFIVFIAFAQLGYLLFGTQVKDYASVWSSSMSLLQTVIGEFEYKQIEQANQVFGPIFYLLFVFFIIFVLLNMFLAIINDSYSVVKSEVSTRNFNLQVSDFLVRGFWNVLNICCCGLDKKLRKKTIPPDRLTYLKIKDALKKARFSDLEIDMFFAKYDIREERGFGESETRQIVQDLELGRLDFDNPQEDLKMRKDVDRLNQRISGIEARLQATLSKIDSILTSLKEKRS